MTETADFPPFLASESAPRPPAEAAYHVIPVPFERTVSYGSGAARGPAAMLQASQQLEAFDGRSCPCRRGIHTAGPVDCSADTGQVLDRVAAAVRRAVETGARPIVLGGEHTVTLAAVRGALEAGRDVGVVQFDAHADLRDTYEGMLLSHACVARRILELGVPLAQLGVRSLSEDEHRFRQSRKLPAWDARSLACQQGIGAVALPEDFPGQLYVTVDVDVLDPSLMPATGTPEPGGLAWYELLELLEAVARGRALIAADVVELAPVPGLHHCDFTAAKLAYALMAL